MSPKSPQNPSPCLPARPRDQDSTLDDLTLRRCSSGLEALLKVTTVEP